MGSSAGGSTVLSHHEGVPMGDERVLQLAGHHRRPTDGVRWVACTKFFISEDEHAATESLKDTSNIMQQSKHLEW